MLELKKITLLSGEEEKLLLIANPHRLDEYVVGKFRMGRVKAFDDFRKYDQFIVKLNLKQFDPFK